MVVLEIEWRARAWDLFERLEISKRSCEIEEDFG